MLLGGLTTEFHMYKYLPFLPIEHWFRLSNHLLISQATPFAGDAYAWKNGLLRLFAAISQVSTCHLCAWGPCMGVRRAMALFGDAKQATGEGKSGLVETGLTRPRLRACTDR